MSTTPPKKTLQKRGCQCHLNISSSNSSCPKVRVIALSCGNNGHPMAKRTPPLENERQNPEVLKQRVLIVVHSFYVSFYFHIITTVIKIIIITTTMTLNIIINILAIIITVFTICTPARMFENHGMVTPIMRCFLTPPGWAPIPVRWKKAPQFRGGCNITPFIRVMLTSD